MYLKVCLRHLIKQIKMFFLKTHVVCFTIPIFRISYRTSCHQVNETLRQKLMLQTPGLHNGSGGKASVGTKQTKASLIPILRWVGEGGGARVYLGRYQPGPG